MPTAPERSEFRRPRKRVAAGPPRPQYLESRDLDRLMMMLIALMGEVAAIRDRMDTCEALAEDDKPSTRAAIEAFRVSPERRQERDDSRQAMFARVFRLLLEEIETPSPPPSGAPTHQEF